MARWSFGLRQLFLWTAAIALGTVALRSASTTWVAAMLGLATAALAVSILLIVFRHGPKRAYWVGFATFGGLYMLVLVASWTLARIAGNDGPLAAHNLPTQQLASGSYHWLYDEAFEKYHASLGYSGDSMGGMGYSGGPRVYPILGMLPGRMGAAPPPGPPPGPNETDFVNVAHALWTLLFAVVGGCLAYWLYVTGPGRSEPRTTAST